MHEMLMQRDVAILLAGLLLGAPANAFTVWVGAAVLRWWRAGGAGASGNVSTRGGTLDAEPEGSWLSNAVGIGIVAVPLLAVAPFVLVLMAGTIYFFWRLAWLLVVALWRSATGAGDEDAPGMAVDGRAADRSATQPDTVRN